MPGFFETRRRWRRGWARRVSRCSPGDWRHYRVDRIFCYGELGARNPQAGGGYVYLRDAFGELPAFLYAWSLLLIIATGAIAGVAVTFANYTVALFGMPDTAAAPRRRRYPISAINYLGVKPGAVTQNVFALLKLVPLVVLIVASFLSG